jgi:nitrilase
MAFSEQNLTVGLAQIAPVWMKKAETLDKILHWIDRAADAGCEMVVFGEALLPGYPFWLSQTGGARFNDATQKELFAWYAAQSVNIKAGDLDDLRERSAKRGIHVVLGCVERAADRGGHSLYCSLITCDENGRIVNVHRKLMPTYEERLVWAQGDGNGLHVHAVGPFTVGGLNCWENWMPMARTALYAQGENCHIAVWPGSRSNTEDITRFMAKESRSYVISVSGLLRTKDMPEDIPHAKAMSGLSEQMFADGGSCIAAPDGSWIVEPANDDEQLITAVLEFNRVLEERQNFDPSGHYARPDVLTLSVNRERQSVVNFMER